LQKIERRILTRGDELDQEGLVPPDGILRYFEYLRWESVEDDVLSIAPLLTDGHRLVVVGQKLRVLQDIGRGADCSVAMWVGKLWWTGLAFANQLSLADGTPVAQAQVTTVYLDASDRPVPLPEDYRGRVAASGAFPDMGPRLLGARPPENAWRRPVLACPSHVDVYRHVNHASYATYFDDTRLLAAAAGHYGELSPLARGRVRRLAIDYLRQAFQADQLEVLTWALGPGVLAFELRRVQESEPLARGRMEVAFG
jgi:acyl-CoA thioesterase FadM